MYDDLERFIWMWDLQAAQFREAGAEGQAATFEMCARQLRGWIASEESKLVTIAEAAELGGYSEEHLRRLVRSGDLPAVQDCAGGRIRLRARDVPMKATAGIQKPDISPARVDRAGGGAYDPAEDARNIAQAIGG